jgi:hypothetical protein
MTEDLLKEISTAHLLDLMVKTIDEYLLLYKEVETGDLLVSKRTELCTIHKVINDRKAAGSHRA